MNGCWPSSCESVQRPEFRRQGAQNSRHMADLPMPCSLVTKKLSTNMTTNETDEWNYKFRKWLEAWKMVADIRGSQSKPLPAPAPHVFLWRRWQFDSCQWDDRKHSPRIYKNMLLGKKMCMLNQKTLLYTVIKLLLVQFTRRKRSTSSSTRGHWGHWAHGAARSRRASIDREKRINDWIAIEMHRFGFGIRYQIGVGPHVLYRCLVVSVFHVFHIGIE